jgi:hypothetical protein
VFSEGRKTIREAPPRIENEFKWSVLLEHFSNNPTKRKLGIARPTSFTAYDAQLRLSLTFAVEAVLAD